MVKFSSLLASIKRLKRQNILLYWSFLAAVLFLLCYAGYIVFSGLENGLHFQGYAADGSFQTYNPLRRMAAGQIPGRDFQFFHGIGIPIFLFGPFKLLGSNLFASEMSRWLVCAATFVITVFLLALTITKSAYKAVIAVALTIVLLVPMANIVGPDNSLMGLRTALPLVIAACFAWEWDRTLGFLKTRISLKRILLIVLLALAFIMSTEQGIYAAAAYFAVRFFTALRLHQFKLRTLFSLVIEAVLLGLTILILFTLATAGHPVPPLIYALRTIPSQQFWYFGVPPNSYLSWHNLPATALHLYKIYILLAIVFFLYRAASRRGLLKRNVKPAFLFLALYGLFSCASALGYVSFSQFFPLIKVTDVSIILLALLLIDYKPAKKQFRLRIPHRVIVTAYTIAMVVLIGGALFCLFRVQQFQVRALLAASVHARSKPDRDFATPVGWGGALQAFSQIDTAGQNQVWSTYSSFYESNLGIFNPSHGGFDYIIHALGSKNFDAYANQFVQQKPQYVITLRPDYFDYEEWLWTSDWPFYRQLLTHYSIVTKDASHYLWKFTGNSTGSISRWHQAPPTNGTISLPANRSEQVTLYEVRLHYRATTPLNLFHTLPRYLLQPRDTGLKYAVSLPPDQTTWSFVVPVFSNDIRPKLSAVADGLVPGASLKLISANYRTVSTPTVNTQPFSDNDLLCPFKADSINTIYATCLQYR